MSSGSNWRNSLPLRDRARTVSDLERSRATTRCDSEAPTVMCHYGAPDGIAVNALRLDVASSKNLSTAFSSCSIARKK